MVSSQVAVPVSPRYLFISPPALFRKCTGNRSYGWGNPPLASTFTRGSPWFIQRGFRWSARYNLFLML